MRASGRRQVDIIAVLNAEGIPTPGGSPRWCPYHLTRLLQTKTAERAADSQDFNAT
jgi:hypothetical protein